MSHKADANVSGKPKGRGSNLTTIIQSRYAGMSTTLNSPGILDTAVVRIVTAS